MRKSLVSNMMQACECVHGPKEQKEPKSMKLERPSVPKIRATGSKKASCFLV